jgi:glyceraldehyde 3-phosphate dehydrogenase
MGGNLVGTDNRIFITGAGGRIFSCMLRALAEQRKLKNVVGVSASGPKVLSEMAEKLDHDSTHRQFPLHVDCIDEGYKKLNDEHLGFLTFEPTVNTNTELRGPAIQIPIFGQPDPASLPLKELGADVAVDATGKFLTGDLAQGFIDAGAKKVLMTAPAKDDTPLIIYDINGKEDNGLPVVSLASCTTNCAAPIVYAISDRFGAPKTIFLNTTHAVTNSQKMLDGNNKKLANSFAGLNNIVVTDTGATKSLQKIFPDIKQSTGISCRVPVADGSILSLVMEFDEQINEDLNAETILEQLDLFQKTRIPRLLKISDRKTMISTYTIGRSETSIVDKGHIEVIGNIVRIVAGYDNEYAYAYQAARSALICPLP